MYDLAARLFDPAALALVVGGSLAAAGLRSTRADLFRALAALKVLITGDPEGDALSARRAVREIEQIAEKRGTACADRVGDESRFVRRAGLRLADAPSAEAFAQWAAEDLDARAVRHENAIAVWRAAADAAPSLGMLGTVLGLIAMFASMDDPDTLGPAMALALLTTLYGIVAGTLLFGPAAQRLERLSEAELRWQKAAIARLETLVRGEAQTTTDWLKRRNKAQG
nr:MotA/TolQ/ExbB proton channel family protein [uncultured Sphingosinicella sp.]